jgi:DNA segregation ATPase FtsK/SpoIIIE-like protein
LIRFSVTVEDRRRAGGLDRLALEIQVQFGLATPPLLGFDGERLLIDLPRPDRREVTFDEIRDEIPSANPVSGSAQAPLGVDVDGHLRLIDFSRPEDAHLLITGRSGSGKTEWLRSAIAGLTQANTPETLQLILVDLAGEAFPAWRESPFLHSPLINTTDLAIETLSALGDEMERRYLLMRQLGIDSVGAGLAGKSDRPIPRIFFVCDEYTDLISGNRQKRQLVERQISRLGQRARAAGIHLVIATRHTRREIIRGVLDSTFPARIGLQMGKGIESKMLLNQAGAERLLGQGDLLFRDGGSLVRLQGARVRPGSYPE